MSKVTIKKISDEVVYRKSADNYVFEVNGKKVRVGTYQIEDYEMEEYDGDQEVNEEDLKALTDEEAEAFGEDLSSWLDIKVGEEEIITNEE